MRLNFYKTFKTRDGETIMLGDTGKPMTGFDACIISLDYTTKPISGEEKYKRYQLSKKVEMASSVDNDFTVEELSFLKTVIGDYPFNPNQCGQLWDWIDQKDVTNLKAVG